MAGRRQSVWWLLGIWLIRKTDQRTGEGHHAMDCVCRLAVGHCYRRRRLQQARLGWAKLVSTLRSLSSAEEEDVDVKDINVVVVVRWTVSLHDGQFRSGQVKGMRNYITDYIIEVI